MLKFESQTIFLKNTTFFQCKIAIFEFFNIQVNAQVKNIVCIFGFT